jgi:protein arginine N-methyltransferase 3
MSYQIPSSSLNVIDDDGSSSGGEEDRLSDWASSLGAALQTKSLFSDRQFPNPEAALAYDTEEHNFDIKAESISKGLDLYGRMRLINWIRSEVRLLQRLDQECNGAQANGIRAPVRTRLKR